MSARIAFAASPAAEAEDAILDPSPALDSPLESILEANYTTCRNRADRPSFSSDTSSGSGSTDLTSPDSDSTTPTEAQTWGTQSTDPGDQSINSIPSLPVNSQSGDTEMDNHYIPNLDNLIQSRIIDHDPAPGTQSHLPCPFRWDGCEVMYDILERKKWIYHSLDHFTRLGIQPPAHLICPYGDCPERFVHENGTLNWRNRMNHYAQHVEETLKKPREIRSWVVDDDLDVEGMGVLDMPEKVDINFQQYLTHHGANRVGLDRQINPNPRSELDNIPRGFMNRMHPAYGGPRFREVVYPPFDDPVEQNLDSRSAGAMFVRDSRRTGEAAKVWTARTSGEAFMPFQRQISRYYSLNGRREASERIIRK